MPADRDVLLDLYDGAVAGAAPGPITGRAVDALDIPPDRRVLLFAFGKAAHTMASAAVDSLLRSLHQIVGGVMVTPEAHPAPYPTVTSMLGDHPTPSRRSFDAASRIADAAAGRRASDVALVLISGGTSSLIGAPLNGHGEDDLRDLFRLLLESGLDIGRMNTVRKRFSRWGAGRLALALAPAATHCLAASDVIGDDISAIGSGPCTADPSTIADVARILDDAGLQPRLSQTARDYIAAVSRGVTPETPKRNHPAFAHVSARVIATNRLALNGAAARARDSGFVAQIQQTPIKGPAAAAGEQIARTLLEAKRAGSADGAGTLRCLIWGGETTVALGDAFRGGEGAGGRCQELALAAARVLAEAGDASEGISILAAGTDGRDGATEAAGAIVDASIWPAIARQGIDPAAALARHESNAALDSASAIVPRRITGTNVMDVVIGVIH